MPQGPKKGQSQHLHSKSNSSNVKIPITKRKDDVFQAPFFRSFLLVLVWETRLFSHGCFTRRMHQYLPMVPFPSQETTLVTSLVLGIHRAASLVEQNRNICAVRKNILIACEERYMYTVYTLNYRNAHTLYVDSRYTQYIQQ